MARAASIVTAAALALAITLLTSASVPALDAGEALPDARLEARARGLSAELRCLVCQNQSIDDSNAPLAKDLRRLVRERITAGDSDAQVMRYIVDRYGEFVLLKPPLGLHTLLLWTTPALVLALTGWWMLRRRATGMAAPDQVAPLSEEERRRLDRLLGRDG